MKPPSSPTRPTGILGIVITVFLDLLSFGMFIPDIQLRGKALAAMSVGVSYAEADTHKVVAVMVGGLLAIFSLCQLISSPVLGRMSDRIGRRKVLLITIGLSVVSYLLYSHADTYLTLFIARALSGLAAANLGVAFAYVADVTAPENRAKGLGMVGAALGVGFILGPTMGALLLRAANDNPVVLGYTAAFLAVVNFVYVIFFLPESLSEEKQDRHKFLAELRIAFRTPVLGLLLGMFFVFNFAFAMLQATYFLLLADPRSVYHLTSDNAKTVGGIIMSLVGVSGAFAQGFLVPRIVGKYGEVKVLKYSFLLLAPALATVPFQPLWVPAVLGVFWLGISSGVSQPSINALISRNAPPEIQGGIFGINQALGAMARLLGPMVAIPLFTWHPAVPYLLGGLLILFPLSAAWRLPDPRSTVVGYS